MNEFSELESELKNLRPVTPSAELFRRIEQAMAQNENDETGKIVRPARFQINWLSLGIALSAAAILLVFARFELPQSTKPGPTVAGNTPAHILPGHAAREHYNEPAANRFVPAEDTQIVYDMRDEGLLFPSGGTQPVRRVRSKTHETWRWQNPATGASLRVSYPSEQIELIPIAGQ